MAQIKDVLEIEGKRETFEQCVVIHLFEEGTFYRAYQWSAWLCHRYIKAFKPTRRKLKQEDETLVYVGFPITSLMNYVSEGLKVNTVAEKQIDIILNLSVFQENLDIESIKTEYVNWKESVPLSESSKKKIEEPLLQYKDMGNISAMELLSEIASFPLEQKTMMDSLAFLSQIKQQALKLIIKP